MLRFHIKPDNYICSTCDSIDRHGIFCIDLGSLVLGRLAVGTLLHLTREKSVFQ
jgi:hypothetical protein